MTLVSRRYQSGRSPPKIWLPSLNASVILIPAPGFPGFVSCHAARCSSDRKKLRVVQSESHALRSSSARLPTHTMIPAASGPDPEGSTENATGTAQW